LSLFVRYRSAVRTGRSIGMTTDRRIQNVLPYGRLNRPSDLNVGNAVASADLAKQLIDIASERYQKLFGGH